MNKFVVFVFVWNTIFLGCFTYFSNNQYKQDYKITETRDQSYYRYVNPLLECDIEYEYYNPWKVKKNIENYIISQLNQEEITTISYYFRSLENGEYFGYNLDEEFVPASLLKLPLSMSVLKHIPLWELSQKYIKYDESNVTNTQRNYGKDLLENAGSYPLDVLMKEMLQNSDNVAASVIFQYLWYDIIHEVYQRLGLPDIDLDRDEYAIVTTRKYSSFFRILYNASYLPEDASEYILSLLAKWNFNQWIRYYIPNSIEVANKFWERSWWEDKEKQIHDCWIIYIESPYLLCVMTKGFDFNKQLKIIQDISKMIYEYKIK